MEDMEQITLSNEVKKLANNYSKKGKWQKPIVAQL